MITKCLKAKPTTAAAATLFPDLLRKRALAERTECGVFVEKFHARRANSRYLHELRAVKYFSDGLPEQSPYFNCFAKCTSRRATGCCAANLRRIEQFIEVLETRQIGWRHCWLDRQWAARPHFALLDEPAVAPLLSSRDFIRQRSQRPAGGA